MKYDYFMCEVVALNAGFMLYSVQKSIGMHNTSIYKFKRFRSFRYQFLLKNEEGIIYLDKCLVG